MPKGVAVRSGSYLPNVADKGRKKSETMDIPLTRWSVQVFSGSVQPRSRLYESPSQMGKHGGQKAFETRWQKKCNRLRMAECARQDGCATSWARIVFSELKPMSSFSEEKILNKLPSATMERNSTTAYFQSVSSYWDEVYSRRDVYGVIYQLRLANVLALVDGLALPTGSRILDLGCGVGVLSVALAKRGYHVEAVDAATAMIDHTRRRAAEAAAEEHVNATVGDAHRLDFPDRAFPLALSVGVIPWLDLPQRAIGELARVIKPGGYLLLTADNSQRLDLLLDPLRSPAFSWMRRTIKNILGFSWQYPAAMGSVCSARHSIQEIDQLFAAAGLKRVCTETVGFGPFTFFDRRFFSGWFGVKVHRMLQYFATLGCPGLSSTGAHIIVLAKKLPE